jgi:hypothetical protein
MIIESIIHYAWIILPVFFLARILAPILTADKEMKHAPTQDEIEHFKEYRVHNVTLATFVIAAVLLIFGLNLDDLSRYTNALLYLSVGMFSFIFASYLLTFRLNRWTPYLGRTFEFTGLIAVAVGFLELIASIVPLQTPLVIAYFGFLVGIVCIAGYELAINIQVRYKNMKK